jgi:hypothetical protein
MDFVVSYWKLLSIRNFFHILLFHIIIIQRGVTVAIGIEGSNISRCREMVLASKFSQRKPGKNIVTMTKFKAREICSELEWTHYIF